MAAFISLDERERAIVWDALSDYRLEARREMRSTDIDDATFYSRQYAQLSSLLDKLRHCRLPV